MTRKIGEFSKYPLIWEIFKILKFYQLKIPLGVWEVFKFFHLYGNFSNTKLFGNFKNILTSNSFRSLGNLGSFPKSCKSGNSPISLENLRLVILYLYEFSQMSSYLGIFLNIQHKYLSMIAARSWRKHISRIIRNKHFQTSKNNNVLHIIDHRKVSMLPFWKKNFPWNYTYSPFNCKWATLNVGSFY